MLVQGVAEGFAQAVRLTVQKGIDEFPALCPVQIYFDVTERTLELIDDGLQRMSFALSIKPLPSLKRKGPLLRRPWSKWRA